MINWIKRNPGTAAIVGICVICIGIALYSFT